MIHIIGGGTFAHVRSHLALAAPAFGGTARQLHEMLVREHIANEGRVLETPMLHLTKMADHESNLVTNDDVDALLEMLIDDPETRVIIMNAALCDFEGSISDTSGRVSDAGFGRSTDSGKYAERLKSSRSYLMQIDPADKLIGKVRKTRKDIFLVAFKTTTGATSDEQYLAGLNLLKANSCNLVVANDTVTRNNMIIAPEETRYCETTDRALVLKTLVEMVRSRSTNTFTRSAVVPGELVSFQNDARVPDNIRQVVNHLVERGAYKVFRNATVGHFAVKLDDGRCLTSRRKTNYTQPGGLDLVEIEYDGFERVKAYGAKPSVGGQSQRIVFAEHDGMDCIVHFHSPMLEDAPDAEKIGRGNQFFNECGSHQCGQTTSRNLRNYTGDIMAVMLDNHGPNIVFSRDVDPREVIDFIERNFEVEAKTGGLVEAGDHNG